MADAPSRWSEIVEGNSLIRFIDINLRGAGQVIFQNNPLTGLFFLAAIVWGAITVGQIAIAIGSVIALFVATSIAMLLGGDRLSLRQGMFGFNGLLVGAAVPALLAPRPAMWFILVIGAAVSTVVMLAVSKIDHENMGCASTHLSLCPDDMVSGPCSLCLWTSAH